MKMIVLLIVMVSRHHIRENVMLNKFDFYIKHLNFCFSLFFEGGILKIL